MELPERHGRQVIVTPDLRGGGRRVGQQQVQIARVKLQHELYDRRFAVFDAARKLLLEVITNGDASPSALNAYTIGTTDAIFLLDEKITEYLGEIAAVDLIDHENIDIAAVLPCPLAKSEKDPVI